MPNIKALRLRKRRILKMGFFVRMSQLVTPGAGPVLTPGASYKQTWYRSTRRSYIHVPHIKALSLPVSDKNFEIFLLCSYVPTCHPGMGSFLTAGASFEQTW